MRLKEEYEGLLKRISEAAQNERQKAAVKAATNRLKKAKESVYLGLTDPLRLRAEASEIRSNVVDHLDDLTAEFVSSVKSRGGFVFLATGREEAVRYVVELARREGVRKVVKSKSMVTEEVELNKGLGEAGIVAVETDLGERIVQLAGQKPSHILAPAMHMTRFEVAELFSKHSGVEVKPEPDAITQEARRSLREEFLSADMGVSGVNFAVAETGTLILVTNEGNGRLVTSLPRIHVAIFGAEKILPTMSEALHLLNLLPKTATGQKMTSYVSFINGTLPFDHGERQLHVVILDNGRSRMKQDAYLKEALKCIKCAACLSICPTYKIVGGHVFGDIYSGPIGIPWTAYTSSLEDALFSHLCISCGLCETICPVSIDIPKLIIKVKEKQIESYGQPRVNQFIAKMDRYTELTSNLAPISNLLFKSRVFRYLLEKATGIDRRRTFPRYHRRTLRKIKSRATDGRRVAYFHDLYANYNDPDLGLAVIDVLERNGCSVVLPEQKHSGMPLLAYGNIKPAEKLMRFNVEYLYRLVKEGYEIVVSEPTAAYCIRKLYPEFLGSEEAEQVAEKTYELFEYLEMLESKGLFNTNLKKFDRVTVGYHAPCHTKSLLPTKPATKFLEMMGFEVRVADHGCCGIAGTFGFKKGWEGYDLSMEVGKELFEFMADPSISMLVTESSVCKMQVEAATGRVVNHPVKLLREAYSRA